MSVPVISNFEIGSKKGKRDNELDDFKRARVQKDLAELEKLISSHFVQREIDEKELAVEVYSEALDLFPESVSLLYGRAMTFEVLGDIAGMEKDLRTILVYKPNNATTLNALGYTLTVHTERYEEAANLIEKALQLSPGEPAILDSLGWVYFKLGRFLQAADLLKEAYARFPDAEVAAHLGEVLWVSGKEQDALAIWRASLQQQPDAIHVTQALERLGVLLEDTAVE